LDALSAEEAHRFECEYPFAAAKTFAGEAPFRFVYTSGALVERDLNKELWYMHRSRRLKVQIFPPLSDNACLIHLNAQGETEVSLLALAKEKPNLSVVITRPAAVYDVTQKTVMAWIGTRSFAIHADELAAVSVEAAVGSMAAGGKDERQLGDTLDNASMVVRGKELLATTP
jgi:hypothetical protein